MKQRKGVIDNFDDLVLPGPAVHCTYCWQTHHYANAVGKCGPDGWRYLTTKNDYLAYIRQYLANDHKHSPLGQEQLRLFEGEK